MIEANLHLVLFMQRTVGSLSHMIVDLSHMIKQEI
jgi:hypothetical protein